MKVVPIQEAKTQLSRLIQQALEGEEIVIAKRDEPLVRLEVIREKASVRRFGGLKRMVLSMGPSFDDPLEDFVAYAPGELAKVAETPGEG